jgi:hypothetical protein
MTKFGFPRELLSLMVSQGAFLLPGSSATSSWTTSVRLSGTTIVCELEEDTPHRILDTVFELLRLSGCQSDPDLFPKLDQELDEQYHLHLDLDKAGYDAFAQRVRRDGCWVSSGGTNSSTIVRTPGHVTSRNLSEQDRNHPPWANISR